MEQPFSLTAVGAALAGFSLALKHEIPQSTHMIFHRSLACLLIVSVLGATGCTPHSDPMKDWKEVKPFSDPAVPESIKQDATTFFQTLSGQERSWWVNNGDFAATYWENGTGQHAVILKCPHDGECWCHALIYDRDDRRIKVLKYSTGVTGRCDVSEHSNTRLADVPRRNPNTRPSEQRLAVRFLLHSELYLASPCR